MPVDTPCPPPSTKGRLALVIGNAAYATGRLNNPLNDAGDMGDALRSLGWSVDVLQNADAEQMRRAVASFVSQLKPEDDAVLYFSGHGVQIDGENYLLPVGPQFTSQADVTQRAIAATSVLKAIAGHRSGVSVFILDACRDNPLPASARGTAGGLAVMDAKRGFPNSLIAYATAPGSVASDGTGRNGTYTASLLHHLRRDVYVGDVLVDVRRDVIAETEGAQTPWESSSLVDKFRFTAYEEPLRIEAKGNGQYAVSEAQTGRAMTYTTRAAATEVRRLALRAFHEQGEDWPRSLGRALAHLEDAIASIDKLSDYVRELPDDPACQTDRGRLLEDQQEAENNRADLEFRAASQLARAAVNRPLQEGCAPRRPRWLAIGTGTAAAASAIAAGVLLVRANSTWDKAQAACPDGICQGESNDGPTLARQAKRSADWATVFSVGAIGLGGGLLTYLLWPAPADSGATDGRPSSLEVSLAPRTARVEARIEF